MADAYRTDLGRVVLREFDEGDRAAFLALYAHPRFAARVAVSSDDAAALFDRFLSWRSERPRTAVQLAIADRAGRLIGDVGARRAGDAAIIGIDLHPDQWGRYRLALDCLRAAIPIARDLGAARIVAETRADDPVTARLATALGAREVASGDPSTRRWQADL